MENQNNGVTTDQGSETLTENRIIQMLNEDLRTARVVLHVLSENENLLQDFIAKLPKPGELKKIRSELKTASAMCKMLLDLPMALESAATIILGTYQNHQNREKHGLNPVN